MGTVMSVMLTNGSEALIDSDDWAAVRPYKWSPSGDYAAAKIEHGKPHVFLHRFIMGAKRGESVDHINGVESDNRRSNLRVCSHKENRRNSKLYANSTTGKKGVRAKKNGTFEAHITVDGKWLSLGTHHDKETAARAYDAAAIKYFGEFARLNFPGGV